MGRGDVKAPLALSVPARSVLLTPELGNLKKREIGSTAPCSVSLNLRREISEWSVRMLLVNKVESNVRL
ncbi:protein of unknown function [Burkholderia multivorans]